jgi:hypothetical protein
MLVRIHNGLYMEAGDITSICVMEGCCYKIIYIVGDQELAVAGVIEGGESFPELAERIRETQREMLHAGQEKA